MTDRLAALSLGDGKIELRLTVPPELRICAEPMAEGAVTLYIKRQFTVLQPSLLNPP
jgi:hypothetical protein